MALLAGNVASFKLSTALVVQMQKWSLNFGPNLQDTASFGDTWEEKSKALKKWSGTVSGQAVAFGDDTTGQDALRTAAINGTTVTARFYEDATKYWEGTAYIELAASADESSATQERTYTVTGTGALTYN